MDYDDWNRLIRHAEISRMLDTFEAHGVDLDGATKGVLDRYVEGKAGLADVARALDNLLPRKGGKD